MVFRHWTAGSCERGATEVSPTLALLYCLKGLRLQTGWGTRQSPRSPQAGGGQS